MRVLSPRRRHDVEPDPIADAFRDYKPPEGMLHRDRGAMALESKVAKLRLKGEDARLISIRLGLPEDTVKRVIASIERAKR
jgi:hypothetical protein